MKEVKMRIPVVIGGITRWQEQPDPSKVVSKKPARKPLLREAFGTVIREVRLASGKNLREVSTDAQMALGYLSEVERGRKEPSSEVLASLCNALDLPLIVLLAKAAAIMEPFEGTSVPDHIPVDMVNDVLVGSEA
jgi:ribosome-binding protein aMBF1 (putative translation factor)